MVGKTKNKGLFAKASNKAKVSKPTKQYIKKAISSQIESKMYYFDSGGTGISYDKNGQVVPLSLVTQGVGDYQRIGDVIHPTKLELRLRIVPSTILPDVIRMIVFIWRPNTTPVCDDILYTPAGNDYQSAMSAYNDSRRSDYKILSDKYFALQTNDNIRAFTIVKKLDHKCEYVGATTSHTRGLYFLLLGEGTPAGTYIFNSCLTYKDA